MLGLSHLDCTNPVGKLHNSHGQTKHSAAWVRSPKRVNCVYLCDCQQMCVCARVGVCMSVFVHFMYNCMSTFHRLRLRVESACVFAYVAALCGRSKVADCLKALRTLGNPPRLDSERSPVAGGRGWGRRQGQIQGERDRRQVS